MGSYFFPLVFSLFLLQACGGDVSVDGDADGNSDASRDDMGAESETGPDVDADTASDTENDDRILSDFIQDEMEEEQGICPMILAYISICYDDLLGQEPAPTEENEWLHACEDDSTADSCLACVGELSCEQFLEPHACNSSCGAFFPYVCLQLIYYTDNCYEEVFGHRAPRDQINDWLAVCIADSYSDACIECVMDSATCEQYFFNAEEVYRDTCASACP